MTRKVFLETIRDRIAEAQEKYQLRNPLRNAYYCWIGQDAKRSHVKFEQFQTYHSKAIKDVDGRVNPKNKYNIALLKELGVKYE